MLLEGFSDKWEPSGERFYRLSDKVSASFSYLSPDITICNNFKCVYSLWVKGN